MISAGLQCLAKTMLCVRVCMGVYGWKGPLQGLNIVCVCGRAHVCGCARVNLSTYSVHVHVHMNE